MTAPLLINEPPLQILPALVKATGIIEAIVLQETHYQQNGRPWVPNLGAQLRQRCHFWSTQDIDDIILLLENTGLLLVKGGLPKSHSIDYDLLNRMAETPLKVGQPSNTNKGFSFDMEVRPTNYVMRAENKGYCLDCELTLEIKDHCQQGQVICHFPRINNNNILKLCEGEHIICDIIMVLFQAHILDYLLTFCIKQGASKLVVAPNMHADVSFYREFLSELGLAAPKELTEMFIPVAPETRIKLNTFLKKVHSRLKQPLRQKQKTNPHVAELVDRFVPGFLDK